MKTIVITITNHSEIGVICTKRGPHELYVPYVLFFPSVPENCRILHPLFGSFGHCRKIPALSVTRGEVHLGPPIIATARSKGLLDHRESAQHLQQRWHARHPLGEPGWWQICHRWEKSGKYVLGLTCIYHIISCDIRYTIYIYYNTVWYTHIYVYINKYIYIYMLSAITWTYLFPLCKCCSWYHFRRAVTIYAHIYIIYIYI